MKPGQLQGPWGLPPALRGLHNPRATIRPMSSRSPRRFVGRALALALALALVVGACGSSAPTPIPAPTQTATPTSNPIASPSPTPTPGPTARPSGATGAPTTPADQLSLYRRIEADVERIRGLTARRPVDPQLITEDEIAARFEEDFRAEVPPDVAAGSEALLEHLGLLPADASLTDELQSFLSAGVLGFYDPEAKELFVRSETGKVDPIQQWTFSHEYTHALQDQSFSLDDLATQGPLSGIVREVDGQSDRSLATLALVEGDATTVMFYWAQQRLSLEELLKLAGEAVSPEQAQILAGLPPFLRDTLSFPYQDGFQWVLTRQMSDGWSAIDRVYAKPPASTEQILHPAKYGTDEPVEVTLPSDLARRMGAGWATQVRDTLGELQLRLWLQDAGGQTGALASKAAAGWGGDRIELLQGPNGTWALVIQTTWDSEGDAAEFSDAAKATIRKLGGAGDVLPGAGGKNVSVVLASNAASLRLLANVLGLAG